MHGTTLFGFELIGNTLEHKYCIQEHCVLKGLSQTKACMSSHLVEHMKRRSSIDKPYIESVDLSSTDWSILKTALHSSDFYGSEVLQQFANRNKSYGLRYEIHGTIGKIFVIELLIKLQTITRM